MRTFTVGVRVRLFALLVPMLLLGGCASMLYFPTRTQYYEPKKGGVNYDNVRFPSLDGTELQGWYFPHRMASLKKPKGVFLFFHGNAENLSSHFGALLWILEQGYDYFIFDYRGYGASDGNPTPEGTVKDGLAALDYLTKRTPKDVPMMVFAQSLGGAVAMRSLIEARGKYPVRWLVLDSTFDSYMWAGASVLSSSWITTWMQPFAFLTLSDEWAPRYRLKELSPIPIFVMHGDRDRTIRIELAERYFAELPEPKEFYRIEGGRHIDSFWAHDGRVKEVFMQRLEKILTERWWENSMTGVPSDAEQPAH